MISALLNSSEDGNILKKVKTFSFMSLEGLNGCFQVITVITVFNLGNYRDVLCTAKLVVSIRVLFFKFTALTILMTRNTHNKWNVMLSF